MSNVKKFFSKLKSEVKFAKAGEGHRLNDPTPAAASRPTTAQARPEAVARQPSESGPASRAAAEAAQQRFQQQASWQQSATASENLYSAIIEVDRACISDTVQKDQTVEFL